MPSEKRARQRSQRNAKLEAERKTARRKSMTKRTIIVIVVAAAVVVSAIFLFGSNGSSSPTPTTTTSSTTTTTPTSTTTPVPTTTANQAAVAQAKANAIAVAAGCPKSPSTSLTKPSWSTAPPMTIDTSKKYQATFVTTAGTFVVSLEPKLAPQTVNSFVFLAKQGYYHCIIFHRVIPGFMNQTGDPTGTGSGGPGYTIPDENPPAATPQYPLGSVAMANTGQPHSGGSQFFIVAGSEGESLPNTYALFGKVVAGMPVIMSINNDGSPQGVPPNVTQRILSVTITTL